MIANKENCPPLMGSHKIASSNKLLKKQESKLSFSGKDVTNGGGGMFGRLLSEATDEIRSSLDESAAVKLALAEARELSESWRNEEKDYQFANILARDIEDEIADQMREDETLGEMEAIRIAIEERRCALYEENYLREQEENDIEYASRLAQEEADEKEYLERACVKDSELAEQMHKQLHDEYLAEEIHKSEVKQEMDRRSRQLQVEEEDFKIAKVQHDNFEKEQDHKLQQDSKLQEFDFETASKLQREEDRSRHETKRERERKDEKAARHLMRQMSREEHRNRKKKQVVASLSESSFTDLAAIGELWGTAEAEIEDVEGGICITVLLPHLLNMSVCISPCSLNKIEVEARRFVIPSDSNATPDNSCYTAEFIIDGIKQLSEKNLSYEYSSESGMLHVYLDNISLGRLLDQGPMKSKKVISDLMDSFHRVFA
mmetsp:Transcript_28963/g.29308  ORF Transcript_28963/g.29308 Transcript_28963/m.29308 type:complete len:432 (+) Transcript_28963:48-1343(+)|eukprot:CAMPEP_0182418812 /NCGR_PEP_ID=MMETSP1167-20130531/3185_1 /TAXON_ID=2988 /ORGANISM="Mallomonas Sp, Strain CCMP3275" /LENGTH=431 /DNA_ID=CAMNT_0024593221 /DNA_START=42 /DNA_END=1337 /DNA_ORIENTATION=+